MSWTQAGEGGPEFETTPRWRRELLCRRRRSVDSHEARSREFAGFYSIHRPPLDVTSPLGMGVLRHHLRCFTKLSDDFRRISRAFIVISGGGARSAVRTFRLFLSSLPLTISTQNDGMQIGCLPPSRLAA